MSKAYQIISELADLVSKDIISVDPLEFTDPNYKYSPISDYINSLKNRVKPETAIHQLFRSIVADVLQKTSAFNDPPSARSPGSLRPRAGAGRTGCRPAATGRGRAGPLRRTIEALNIFLRLVVATDDRDLVERYAALCEQTHGGFRLGMGSITRDACLRQFDGAWIE